MVTTQQKKFIDLLKEMFQFDQADLDFGIYRIMNQKREEITNFLNNELIPQVKKAFEKYRNKDIEEIKKQMVELEQKLNEMGVAKESSEKYLVLKERLNKGVDITALENEVFSDLTKFFRRYYYEGDFLSLRRYKKNVYAIPYEGEEVKLHWANADQYYVKTSEYFRDYSFKLPSGKIVRFKLIDANTEQNNNKEQEGQERRFILFEEEPLKEENGELYIQFEYKPSKGKQMQKLLNEKALERLYSLTDYEDWLEELQILAPTEKNKNRTLLEKYINDFTARNTFDYFIHKDLGGFLRRELDFFIKNEIMHLDDLDTENEKNFEQYISKVKVIKSIGNKIITFLEQIENFQKNLWLKKKFVVETNYCVTLDKVPKELYTDILENKEQIVEWNKLFAIEDLNNGESLTVSFLNENPYLVLDTKFFEKSFVDRLLSSFDNLDQEINGIIIHGENFQALSLLEEKYNKEVNYIYIDPPYNAKSSEILYKNNFKHSSWLSLMENRIRKAKGLLKDEGVFTCAIDEVEQERLGMLIKEVFDDSYEKTCVSIIHNPSGQQGDNFSYTHDFAYFVYRTPGRKIGQQYREDENEWDERNFRDVTGADSLRTAGANCFYPIYVKNGNIIGFGDVCEDSFHPSVNEKLPGGVIAIYPVDPQGVERKWRFARNTVEKIKDELKVHYIKSRGIYDIKRLKKHFNFKTVWTGAQYSANNHGTQLLNNIIPKAPFSYPKSLYTVKDCIIAGLNNHSEGVVLDFFAGSGTTAHAVIELNREDNGNRKYILVEMGEYFNSVTKPRIQKVVYSKDWRNGKPVSRNGISHMFKYIKLESFEDTLNNIRIYRSPQQQVAMDEFMTADAREEYLLSYMLNVESKGSPSLLDIDAFNNPFEYKMMIKEGTETNPKNIDLVETFNFLIGLHVKTIDVIKGIKVISGYLRNGEKVLILWRNTNEVSNEQLENFFKKQGYNTRDNEFDRIYVNGDNHLENLKLAEDKWKVVLIEEEFKRLMFDVQDV